MYPVVGESARRQKTVRVDNLDFVAKSAQTKRPVARCSRVAPEVQDGKVGRCRCPQGWDGQVVRYIREELASFMHPAPGTRDDVVEISPGSPSQQFFSLCRIGHQNRRIARPPRSNLSSNRASCGTFGCTDHFEDGMSPAGP